MNGDVERINPARPAQTAIDIAPNEDRRCNAFPLIAAYRGCSAQLNRPGLGELAGRFGYFRGRSEQV